MQSFDDRRESIGPGGPVPTLGTTEGFAAARLPARRRRCLA